MTLFLDYAARIHSESVPSRTALSMAILSKLAYEGVSAFDVLAGDDLSATPFSVGDTQGVVFSRCDIIIVAFRGTELVIGDILTDLDIDKVSHGLVGKVHHGFKKAFDESWPIVKPIVSSLLSRNVRPVFLCGHSLGGALAMLCASAMITASMPVAGVFTFGCPRVGDRDFASFLNAALVKDRNIRFINNNDIVPRVPLESMGYQHAGTKVVITEDLGLIVNPGFWQRLKDRVEGYIEGLSEDGIDSIEDHGIQQYIDSLSDIASKKEGTA